METLSTLLLRTMQTKKKKAKEEMFYKSLQNEIMRLLFWAQKGVFCPSLYPILPANLLLSMSSLAYEVFFLLYSFWALELSAPP